MAASHPPSGALLPPPIMAVGSAPWCVVHSMSRACLGAAALIHSEQQDIELVVNDADQERAFNILTSQGARPAIPEDSGTEQPITFKRWRELASLYRFRDRRRVRLCVPIYELPQ